MKVLKTELNDKLSEAIFHRIAAEQSVIAGRAGFWRYVGLGLLSLGIGAATALGFIGYALIVGNTNNFDQLTNAISKALNETKLQATATGKVTIDQNEIRIASGQTIGLDPTSRLRLDPNAKVLADGELRVEAPSISRAPSQQTPSRNSQPATITNFTIFKSISFEKGKVITGWNFLTSAQRTPTTQYCYYTENAESPGLNIVVNIADDERLSPPKNVPRDFDVPSAFEKCVWFRKST